MDKLSRSRTHSMIGGVCGGLGRALRIDPTLVRLFFVLLALSDGIGVLIYIILWIVMPLEAPGEGEAFSPPAPRSSAQTSLIVGGALVAVGIFLLIKNLNIPWLWWLDSALLWPALLVIAGIALLIRSTRGEYNE